MIEIELSLLDGGFELFAMLVTPLRSYGFSLAPLKKTVCRRGAGVDVGHAASETTVAATATLEINARQPLRPRRCGDRGYCRESFSPW